MVLIPDISSKALCPVGVPVRLFAIFRLRRSECVVYNTTDVVLAEQFGQSDLIEHSHYTIVLIKRIRMQRYGGTMSSSGSTAWQDRDA